MAHRTNGRRDFRVFVSHCVDDKKFVFEVCDLLSPYLQRSAFFLFERRPSLDRPFMQTLDKELRQSQLVLIFVGKRFDEYMNYEAARAATMDRKLLVIIDIGGHKDIDSMPPIVRKELRTRHILTDNYTTGTAPGTVRCATDILDTLNDVKTQHPALKSLKLKWSDEHWHRGLPSADVFNYEKDIIRFYVAKRCREMLDQGLAESQADELRARYEQILKDWPQETITKTLEKGIAADWPTAHRYMPLTQNNPLPKIKHRSDHDVVRAAALVSHDAPGKPLVFPEAGPREKNALPTSRRLNVAIIVAGGIAPGINAVIDAIVQRHDEYRRAADRNPALGAYALQIIGLKNGLFAFDINGGVFNHSRLLTSADTTEHATRGGSMLGTSRDAELLDPNPQKRSNRLANIAGVLRNQNIDVLYVIGGDGSMKAAHALWHQVNSSPAADNRMPVANPGQRMSVVAIPKTMDNDILWVWQSFGFLSAVEEAREIVERLHTEVRSNPRLGIVQFFGSGSGFVVSHAVLAAATGHTTLALIPEIDFSVIGVARYVKQRLWESANPANVNSADPAAPIDPSIPHGLIVMAETAIPLDAMQCLGLEPAPPGLEHFYSEVAKHVHPSPDEKEALRSFFENGRRVQGQTSDNLRRLGIKLLCEALPILLKNPRLDGYITNEPAFPQPDWQKLRMVRNEPRYLVRALEPSTSDIINGERLGLLAVDAAMAGYTDCMISQWLTEFAIIPLELVVLGRKRIPPEGMFWNSVVAKTRQFNDLVHPFPRATAPEPAPPPASPNGRKSKVARGRARVRV